MMKYFHGEKKKGPFFEGWYFKCQGRDGGAVGVIPALHISPDGQRSASVQVITERGAWWQEYPAADFSARRDTLDIQIGENAFSEKGMQLNMEGEGISLHGSVSFGPFLSLRSDIMGPFRIFSGMECAHSVISMGHALHGQLIVNGQVLVLDGGTGYIESDRGRSFPAAYLWSQCIWQSGSFMLSVAAIPLGKIRFTGCICAVICGGREYRIATYRGAAVKYWSEDGAVVEQGKYRLEVRLLDPRSQPLRAPVAGRMSRTVHESICAGIHVRFWCGGVLMLDHKDACAGFEYSGDGG